MKKNIIILILIIGFNSIIAFGNKIEKKISIFDIKENPKIIQNKKINGVLCSNGEYYTVYQFNEFDKNCICGNFYITHWLILEEDTSANYNNKIIINKNVLTQ